MEGNSIQGITKMCDSNKKFRKKQNLSKPYKKQSFSDKLAKYGFGE